ncbi:MAG TPA: PaaI family thioesterase [Acidimicrobiales bacterium]|nr:PaaI family thioesterase [Acidimicrobiales bacterium]
MSVDGLAGAAGLPERAPKGGATPGRSDAPCHRGSRRWRCNCGHLHGGFIAATFDQVLGMAQSFSGHPGMTGTLTVRFRRPTPLNADLVVEGRLERIEGRKNFTSAQLLHDGVITAEAEGIFITVDFDEMQTRAAES